MLLRSVSVSDHHGVHREKRAIVLGNHVYVESLMLGSSPQAWAHSEHARAAHHVASNFPPGSCGAGGSISPAW